MSLLYSKIKNKLNKVMVRLIPYNTRLRPHSECRIDNEMAVPYTNRELTVHSVYPRHVTQLNISENLFNACSEYWKPEREVTTDYVVVEVPGGRIHTDNECSIAIISNRNRLIDNVSLSLKDGKVTKAGYNSIFEQRFFTKPTRFKGTVFSLLTGGAGLNNISHWFLDVLPRLHLLQKSGLYDQVDWFLVPSLRYDYQRETLFLLGIPEEKLIAGDKYPHLEADKIIASTAPRGNHTLVPLWVCSFIRESFLPLVENSIENQEEGLKLYISRSDSRIRQVLNEAELVNELQPYGFKTIVSSKYSILEKIKIFSQADTVVSATGAGFISMLFCRPGTKIVELFNEGFVIEPFYDIATKIELDYSYIICRNHRKVFNATQGQHEDLTVDIPSLLKRLKKEKKELKQNTSA